MSPLDLLAPSVSTRVGRTFDFMRVAEEEIAKHGGRANSAFGLLYPGILLGYGEELYRAHAREIFARLDRGEDVEPGTKAEVLAVLSKASLKRPPDSTTAALQEQLFAELFPSKVVTGEPTREPWSGAARDVFEDLKRKVALSSPRSSKPTRDVLPPKRRGRKVGAF